MGIEGTEVFYYRLRDLRVTMDRTSKLDAREAESANHGREDASPDDPGLTACPGKFIKESVGGSYAVGSRECLDYWRPTPRLGLAHHRGLLTSGRGRAY